MNEIVDSDVRIRERVLRGIALNRIPGLHFAGNFLDVSYDRVASRDTRVSLEPGPHCADADGQVNIGAVAMVADIALAASLRAELESDSRRLATVSMHLQFTGVAMRERLEGQGECEGFLRDAAVPQGVSRFSIASGGKQACFGTGAFMPLAPPPGVKMHPVVTQRSAAAPVLTEPELDAGEREILRHAEDALARADAKHAFIGRFFGYEPRREEHGARATMKNGAHVANRVGHVQGGLLVGFGASTASAALPATWGLSSVSAWFVSPGEGRELQAESKVWHHGRETAVVRTEVTGVGSRRVLEMVTTHARRKS
jgi:acyl-coenzyme A thioesterase PaaI-like protein